MGGEASAVYSILLPLLVLFLLTSCSTKKNTAGTRFYHSFTAHYNTYFNGEQAFLEGEKAKISAHKDDYTELLPVFLVGVEKSRTTGKSNYETAILKCQKAISLHSIKRRPTVNANKTRSAKTKQYLQRKEFNPFLKNAWLLMGEAQFEKGDFLEAAATFSYITRHYAAEPLVAAEARAWMARCYVQEGWYYDAEDALARVRRDSTARDTRRQMDATQADLLLRQERFDEALPYLERAARQAEGSFRKARLCYLLGQVYRHQGRADEAYKAFARCIKKSPPYEMALNARIAQTEVMADKKGQQGKMISRLRRMARSARNKEYLDQVYYALGNIYLLQQDTAQAVRAYEAGRAKSTRTGIEKGVLLLRLGNLYWDKRRFDDAQKCYTEALGMVDKERDYYPELTRRSKVLDKLVPHTSAVHLQDSLQSLARMSEADRNAAIDRVIEALKKKEEEERKAKRDSAAQARMNENGADAPGGTGTQNAATNTQTGQKDATWYFYNPTTLMQGKQDFVRRWGNRKNEDDWRRSNRTVVAMADHEGYDYEAEDSLQAAADSLAALGEQPQGETAEADSAAADPHTREYYLAQIPFTEEQRAASDAIIMDGLYNAGIIEKDDLEDYPLAAETLGRLATEYPSFEKMNDVYYQQFLLYSRWGRTAEAEAARGRLAAYYPDDEMTRRITAPDFEYLARYGKEIEDSLYAATYQAYRHRDNATVERNFSTSTEKFPSGLNRPKFLFVHALSRLKTATSAELIAELRELLSKYPSSDVSTMAGMIVKGLESGRAIGTGTFDLGSLWDRRTAAADSASAEAAKSRQFSAERSAPFLFVLAYPTDSIDTNTLLYEMAHFNFATFVVRGFDMSVVHERGLSQFRVAGFNTFDECHAYATRLAADATLAPYLRQGRALIISKDNLDLLGTTFSINDYQTFYDKTFAPLQPAAGNLIEETAPIEQHYEDEYSDDEHEKMEEGGDDGGEWY